MASSDSDRTGTPRRPALVDELERMGFRPADATPEAASAGTGSRDAASPDDAPPGLPVGARLMSAPPAGSARLDALPDPEPPRPAGPPPQAFVPDVPLPPAVPALAVPATAVPTEELPATARQEPAPAGRGPAGELTADAVLRHHSDPPRGGWRRAVFVSSFGTINPGPSAAERRERDLVARATRPVPGCWRVAVISLKGGVGKTTTTAGLGVQLATLRGDRVIAVDANPDRGTLAEKVPDPNPATVRDLLRHRESIRRYSDVRAFTSLSPSRMEVLASDADPTASQAFSEQNYRDAIGVLEHFYSLVLTDCGTGLLHSAMSGVLALADSLVVVSSASLDGARSASATLDWLEAHGKSDLVEQAVAVVSSVRPRGGLVDVAAVQEHFARRCRTVVQVPFDPHLEAGATVSLERMSRRTRQAYLELAAAVGDGLP